MRHLFTDGWTVHRADDADGEAVRLPHDAMIGEARVSEHGTGNHGGYFPGGRYRYRKLWSVPADAGEGTHRLVFEGVYGAARIVVDGTEVAVHNAPYRQFTAPLPAFVAGENIDIEVDVDNSDVPNSRWYTGSGIYRPVWLERLGETRIADDGISIVTREVHGTPAAVEAVVDVHVRVDGRLPTNVRLSFELEIGGQCAAHHVADVRGADVAFTVTVPHAQLWSAEHPHLYSVRVALIVDEEDIDVEVLRTGLRTIDVDARHGLRVNGVPVLLRGTAIHHDNGLLGAASFDAAERRRARLLKEAGYNAIRSAHNPLSRAFLDACDEFGLYVMDELTDVWYRAKTEHDGAARFREEWRADAEALIAQDRNRPSVIMYSIGNEIAEAATPEGVDLAREIHAYFAASDPTRPTTVAVNPLLAMMASRAASPNGATQPPERKPATSTAANAVTAKLGRMMVLASTLPAADKATRDVFGAVDIAGYNYGYASYGKARRRYPDRVIVGTESMHGDLPAIWKRVTSVPGVLGDFSWTGWDYLGEVGLGYWTYGKEPGGIAKPFPGILAGCGTFDITGHPTALVHLIQAVWGLTDDPGIAVRPLDRAGQRANKTPWLPTDAISSWSWGQLTGTAEIEVYSGGDQVEVVLNGRSLGRRATGSRKGYVSRFRTRYEPGELLAISYRAGIEIGRTVLRTAGPAQLRLRAETVHLDGPDDLAYVWVELSDHDGIVDLTADDRVHVSVTGPAQLVAYGSSAPSTDERFTNDTHATHRGRALAIVRGLGRPGQIRLRATSERHGEASLSLIGSTPAADTRMPTIPALGGTS